MTSETAAVLIAYIHNNPVRAGVVNDPADSSWRSHRAYLGLVAPPAWLDVVAGLELCGFDATAAGRWAFHELVLSRMRDARSSSLSGRDQERRRAKARADLVAPLKIASAVVERRGDKLCAEAAVVARPQTPIWRPFTGGPQELLVRVANITGISVDRMQSRTRQRTVCRARRVALLAWTRVLGRPAVEMACALGIAASSAAGLLARTTDTTPHDVAARLLR